jgi:hypothetical protein
MKTRFHQLLRKLKKHAVLLLGGLAAITLAVTNLDSLATVWNKHFGQSTELAVLDDAVNQPTLAPDTQSVVKLELVQAPKEQRGDEQLFDIYLRNTSSEDILLTKVLYGEGYLYAFAPIDQGGSHKFAPDSSYTLPVKSHSGESAALSPPYLLRRMSRGAIRFRFTPDKNLNQFGVATLAFELFDSSGNKVAAVNAMRHK